jgi:membrane protease subunit HflC
MKFNSRVFLITVSIAVVIFLSCFYTVNERYVAVEKFLGKISLDKDGNPYLKKPGLHFKLPIVTTVVYFDTRLQTLGSAPERIPTKDQKFVFVDYFVKWKIRDFYKFYLSTNGEYVRVINLLKPRVLDSLRAEFGEKHIEEVVSNDRATVMQTVLDAVKQKAEASLGVEIIDMRIKRIDLPVEVRESVFNRMRTKRQQVANSHRFNGQKKSEEIKATADFNAKRILAEAAKMAEEERGVADATAAKIYSETYNKDPEFYQFYRSMTAYDNIFGNGDNILVVSPDSDFFKYFSQQKSKSKG